MAILIRGASVSASGSSPRAASSNSAQENDLVLLQVRLSASNGVATPPAGFELVSESTAGLSNRLLVYKKQAGGSEPANYEVTFNTGTGVVGVLVIYSDLGNEIVSDGVASQNNGSNETITFPSVTTTFINTLLVNFASINAERDVTPGSGMTKQYPTSGDSFAFAQTQTVAAQGATGTRTATFTTATTHRVATLAFSDAPFEVRTTQAGEYVRIARNQLLVTQIGEYVRVLFGSPPLPPFFPHPPLGEFVRQRLFLLSPATILTATVWTDPEGYPLDRLFIENLSGSVLLARPGMTVVFGETPGGSQLGRSYIRKVGLPIAGGAELYIGRSSRGRFTDGEVDLFAGAHVTVWDDYRVWSKMQVIVTEGDQNESTGVWPVKLYKDSDLLPGSRTNTPPPVANGGPGWASTIDPDTEVITVTFESTSIAVADGATITGVLWDVADGAITLGTDTDNIMQATFPAGFRWVHLTATDSNGNTHMCHIPVFARDPENDLTIPAWQIESHRITASGQQINVRILSDIPFALYPGGTLAMIWEGEPESPNLRSHMSFIGWHANDPAQISIQPTAALRDSTLELVDVAGRLAALAAFSQEVTNTKTSDANTWFEMRAANVWKFLHYLLQWHSTALDLADWHPLFRPDEYTFTVLGADGGNLFDQINNLARMIVPDCALTCNTKGQLYIRPEILLQPFEERNDAVAWNLQPADWTDIRWRHQHVPRVRWLYGGAIIATDTPLVNPETGDEYLPTVFCRAPGETPGQGTEEVRNESQLALSQEELNVVEGHRYAILNSLESEFVITLAGGSLRGIEPADVRWVWLNIPPNVAAQRGFTATNLRGIVREINLNYEYANTGTVRTVELTWEREVLGTPAVSYDVSGFPLPPEEPEE